MASVDLVALATLLVAVAGLAGVVGGLGGLFLGIGQYRESQALKRKEILFNLVKEFDETTLLKTAKKLLDNFYLDPEHSWAKQDSRYYGNRNLVHILRNHEVEWVSDPGEMAVRESIDAILDFFGKLEYLLEVNLIKVQEIVYFDYYLKKASESDAVQKYTEYYKFPLYAKLLSRKGSI